MPLHDLRSPFEERWESPFWRAALDEVREIAWLLALIAGLSAAGVGLAVLLAVT